MPRLLLVDPTYNPGNIPFGVSLGKIEAAFLESGVETDISDFVVSAESFDSLSAFEAAERNFVDQTALKAGDSEVVFICAEHGNELKPYPELPRVLKISAAIKRLNPKTKIIVGGGLVTLLLSVYQMSPDQVDERNIDEFVSGQTIGAIDVIASSLGVENVPRDVPSIWNGWAAEKYPGYASIQMQSGCAFNCDFCFEGKIFSKYNQKSSLGSIRSTIQSLKSMHGISQIVVEDSVILSYANFFEFAELLGAQDIAFSAYVRVSEVCRWPERVQLLKQAGCTCVIIGIETLDDEILASTKKKIVANDTKTALDILRKHGLNVQGCMMLGFPEGGIADARRTIDFALSQDLNCYRWHVFMPNYSQLPDTLSTPTPITLTDYRQVQMDVPDPFLFQNLMQGPAMGVLDEHALIRSLPYLPDGGALVLDRFGYDGFSFGDLVSLMRQTILPVGLPLNEDDMYALLFKESVPHEVTG